MPEDDENVPGGPTTGNKSAARKGRLARFFDTWTAMRAIGHGFVRAAWLAWKARNR